MNPQVLALAGIFQAAELVRQAANHGTWSGYAATACLDSLLCLEADDVDAIYGGTDRLRLGLETLLSVLGGSEEHAEVLQYVVGLMQLQRRFERQGEMQERVGAGLAEAAEIGADLPDHEREDRQAETIAELYCSTLSRLTPRIVVHGKPTYLQNPRTVSWVRTLLFSGLRSAVLWSQLGGGRFNLLFGRRRMIEDARQLLTG